MRLDAPAMSLYLAKRSANKEVFPTPVVRLDFDLCILHGSDFFVVDQLELVLTGLGSALVGTFFVNIDKEFLGRMRARYVVYCYTDGPSIVVCRSRQ